MTWNPALPATNAALLSAPVRDNFAALDLAVMAPVIAATPQSLLKISASDTLQAIAPGTNGHVLTLTAGVPGWAALPVDPGFASPMTTVGDLIRGGTSGAATRLAAVATGAVLASAGVATTPTWNTTPTLSGLLLSTAAPATPPAGTLVLGNPDGTYPAWKGSDGVWRELGVFTAGDDQLLRGTSTGGYTTTSSLTFTGGTNLNTPNLIAGSVYVTLATGYAAVISGGANNGASMPLLVRDASGTNNKFLVSDHPTDPIQIVAGGIQRTLYFGGADSGGSGYRQVVVAN